MFRIHLSYYIDFIIFFSKFYENVAPCFTVYLAWQGAAVTVIGDFGSSWYNENLVGAYQVSYLSKVIKVALFSLQKNSYPRKNNWCLIIIEQNLNL